MRITVLTNRDLASNIALNLLLKSAPQHAYTVLLSSKVGKDNQKSSGLDELKFFEQTLFNQVIFPLVEMQTILPTSLLSFERIHQTQFRVSDITDINSPLGYQTLAAHKPHLIISIRFGQILQQPIIDLPEFGVINLHSGKLPDFRGVMATFWAMLKGQPTIGTTLHYIDSSQIDAGNIISITQQQVDYQRSYLHNVLALYPNGIEQLVETIECIDSGATPKCQILNMSKGSYYSFPDENDLADFKRQGLHLVDYDEIAQIATQYWN
jgi:methionyl-tRNA formyltransferase